MTVMTDSVVEHLSRYKAVQRIPHPKIELFQLKGFLGDELRLALIDLIERDRRPSTIANPNGDSYFRTSETCDLPREDPFVKRLEKGFLELNGIDPALGEPCQGQRYDVGQEFKAHTDYFTPGQ